VPGATLLASHHFRSEADLLRFVEQNIASRDLRPQIEHHDGRMRVHLLRSDANQYLYDQFRSQGGGAKRPTEVPANSRGRSSTSTTSKFMKAAQHHATAAAASSPAVCHHRHIPTNADWELPT
jgi:hypothetical protein